MRLQCFTGNARRLGLGLRKQFASATRYAIEALECRTLLAAVAWTGSAGDNLWTTPGNWSSSPQLPGANDDVTISVAANVHLNSGTQTIKSLVNAEPLSIGGGTLAVSTTAQSTASVTIAGGTISGGSWTFSGGAAFVASTSGGTLSSVAITGDVLLNTTSAGVTLAGNTSFTTARLSANNANLNMAPGYTLSSLVVSEGAATGARNINLASGGPGTVTFSPAAVVRLASGSGAGLNINNSSAATLANNGLITAEATGQTLAISNSTLTNNGTLQVTAGTLNVAPTNWTNPGTVTGTGGTLDIGGTLNATSGIGTFTTSALTVNVSGTITNTGNTITLSATTGSWNLFGGAINNGSVNETASTALVGTTSGGTLSSVAITGDVLLNTTSAGVTLAGNTSFTTARLSANNANLNMAPGYTLSSLVVSEGAATGARNINLASGGAGTVTFSPAAVVRLASGSGAGLNINNSSAATLANNGLITAEATGQTLAISNSTLTNNGTLQVTAGTLNVAPTNWTNPGTVTGTGGTLDIGGTLNATSGIGTFTTSALTVNVSGTITNTGNTITLSATTGSWNLFGGAINNGSVNETASTALVGTTSGGTLSSVAITGDVLLNTTSAGVTLAGNTSFTTARLSANNANLNMAPGYTLSSLVVSEGAATGARNINLASGGAGTVTFSPAAVVRLASGSGAGLNINNSSAATLANNGLITAEATGQTLAISNSTLTNNGTLQVTAGTLNVAPTNWTNPGTVTGTGGTLDIGGTLNATSGIGTFTTSALTVDVSGTITNTGNTITLSATTGSWNLFGGAINNGSVNETASTALVGTTSGGTLSSVAITGDVLLNTTSAGVTLAGNTSFTTARLSANNANLNMAPGYTLSSLVVSEGAATGARNINLASGGAGTVTFSPAAVVRLASGSGAGLNINNSSAATLANNGLITAEATGQTLAISNSTLTNNGTLQVTAGTLNVAPTNWTNPGTVTGTGGTLDIGGTLNATSGIGTFTTSALTVNVSGTITNTGNTITLSATTGSWNLFGGAINNGSVNETASTALVGTTSGGTLSSVAITGDVLLNTTSAGVTLAGNTSFTTARLSANNANLNMAPGYTLSSLVVSEGAAAGARNINLASGAVGTVTFSPAAVVRLASGSGADLNINNSSVATLVNNGLITAEATGRTLGISNSTLTNNGTLQATGGGTLSVSTPTTNNGTVQAIGGGTVNVTGAMNNATGVLQALTGGKLIVSNLSVNLNNAVDDGAGSILRLGGTYTIDQPLAVTHSATLHLTGNWTRAATIDCNGQLIFDYINNVDPFTTVRGDVITGRHGGLWDGPGINSSTAAANSNLALGYAETTAIFKTLPATFGGESVDAHAVVVKLTVLADSNLSGNTNALDFNALATHYGTGTVWTDGDYNYDGKVDSMDFVILAMHFNTALPAPVVEAPVPAAAVFSDQPVSASADKVSLFSDRNEPAAIVEI